MTQEELYKKATDIILDETRDQNIIDRVRGKTLNLINQHVKEVIGEDIVETSIYYPVDAINNEKAEQRKRAGL